MKKTIKISFLILLIIFIKLLSTFLINQIIIYNYNNKIYNNNLIKILYLFNFNQSYIVYYNDGNLKYRNNEFENAINKYNDALKRNPPKKRICDIRINLTLATLQTIDKNSSKNEVINKLEEAKKILLENNCASLDGTSGESNEAEDLKQEIDKIEEEIKNGSNNNSNNNNGNSQTEDENQYNDIEQQIKEKEKNSNASRQSNMSTYENLNNYEYYKGKKW